MNEREKTTREMQLRADQRITILLSSAQKAALSKIAASQYESVPAIVRKCIMTAMPILYENFNPLYREELERYTIGD